MHRGSLWALRKSDPKANRGEFKLKWLCNNMAGALETANNVLDEENKFVDLELSPELIQIIKYFG